MLSNEEIVNKLTSNSKKKDNNDYLSIINMLADPNAYKSVIKGGCNACGGNLNIIKQKNTDSITQQIKKTIQLIMKDPSKAKIFGSFVYKSQYFPSDIDIQEVIDVPLNKQEDIYSQTVNALKKITNDVMNQRGIYFGEIKAGLDNRYNLNIKDAYFIKTIEDMYINGLFIKEEYDYINILYLSHIDKVSCCAYDELEEILRLKKVVRWTQQDIINGYVLLTGDLKMRLIDAVKFNTSIKIDIWAPINGRYIEITNFFILVAYDKETDTVKLLNYNVTDYVKSMLEQIIKYNTKLFYNPFKMAKRIWGVARETSNITLLNKLTPLFQGDEALLNKIIAEIDTIIMMYDKLKSLPIETILKQIDEFKLRISYIYKIELDSNYVDELIDNILNNKNDKELIISELKELKTYFKDIINNNTIIYLKNKGLYPVPEYIFEIKGNTNGDIPIINKVLNR